MTQRIPATRATFEVDGQSLSYSVYGQGPRPCVLLHGLLLSRRMHDPMARALAERGNRVITLDLLGHGTSDRPVDMWRYSMSLYADQVIALLDHLELDTAVVGGTSLGANVSLEVAARAPRRLQAMVIEMPVLDNALLAAAATFMPLGFALKYAQGPVRALASLARGVPQQLMPFWLDVVLDVLRQDPAPSAAVIQGILFGRVAPNRAERVTFDVPTLIIGHPRDPVHPFSDADMLARELPDARLLQATSVLELRLAPQRLTEEIAVFLDGCWPRSARTPRSRTRRSLGATSRGSRRPRARLPR
jgi:pimeloyl-ACP methyl ester carboxylesterase